MDPQTAVDSTNTDNSLLGVVILCVILIVFAWLLLTLQRAAAAVPEPERRFKPGLVWLTVIPFFNTIWWFLVGATGTVMLIAGGIVQAIGGGLETVATGAGAGVAASGNSISSLGVLMLLGGIACFAVFVARVHGAASRLRELDLILDESGA
jgi:hypothetical protein